MTIGTQILQRTKKKVIPTENIKAEVEVAAVAAEADVEIVVDIEAEEVTEAVVVRTAAAIVKTAEATGVATPGEAAVIEMVAETGVATEVVIETAKGGTAVATPERVAETGVATEGPIKMADLRTENSDPATIGVDPEEAVEAPTPLETVMANLNNNLMVTEKMVSINKLYEKTQKNLEKKPKTNKTKQKLKKYLEYHAFVEHVFFAAGPQYLVRPTPPAH